MKPLDKVKTQDPLEKVEAISRTSKSNSSRDSIIINDAKRIEGESFSSTNGSYSIAEVVGIDIEGKNLAERMLHINSIADLEKTETQSKFGKSDRNHYRQILADHIKTQVSPEELLTPVNYEGKKISILELAAHLNLGAKVMEEILDKVNFPKATIESALKITQKQRTIEKTENYKEAASFIGSSAFAGAAESFGEAPGAAIIGGAIEGTLAAGYVAVNKIGETSAKESKKFLRNHLEDLVKKTSEEIKKQVKIEKNAIELQVIPAHKLKSSTRIR